MWAHLLFLRGILADGGHFGRRCPLARASLQQVYARGPRALVVLEVEEHVLVEGEVLLGPAAVLRGLLAQVAALGPLFARNHGQIERVALIVPHALLHRMFTLSIVFTLVPTSKSKTRRHITHPRHDTVIFSGRIPKRKRLTSHLQRKVIQAYHGIKSCSAHGAARITVKYRLQSYQVVPLKTASLHHISTLQSSHRTEQSGAQRNKTKTKRTDEACSTANNSTQK